MKGAPKPKGGPPEREIITQPMFAGWCVDIAQGMLSGMKKPPTPGKELDAFAHTCTVIAEKVVDAGARRHQEIAAEQRATMERMMAQQAKADGILGPDGRPVGEPGKIVVPSIQPPADIEETKN